MSYKKITIIPRKLEKNYEPLVCYFNLSILFSLIRSYLPRLYKVYGYKKEEMIDVILFFNTINDLEIIRKNLLNGVVTIKKVNIQLANEGFKILRTNKKYVLSDFVTGIDSNDELNNFKFENNHPNRYIQDKQVFVQSPIFTDEESGLNSDNDQLKLKSDNKNKVIKKYVFNNSLIGKIDDLNLTNFPNVSLINNYISTNLINYKKSVFIWNKFYNKLILKHNLVRILSDLNWFLINNVLNNDFKCELCSKNINFILLFYDFYIMFLNNLFLNLYDRNDVNCFNVS